MKDAGYPNVLSLHRDGFSWQFHMKKEIADASSEEFAIYLKFFLDRYSEIRAKEKGGNAEHIEAEVYQRLKKRMGDE